MGRGKSALTRLGNKAAHRHPRTYSNPRRPRPFSLTTLFAAAKEKKIATSAHASVSRLDDFLELLNDLLGRGLRCRTCELQQVRLHACISGGNGEDDVLLSLFA